MKEFAWINIIFFSKFSFQASRWKQNKAKTVYIISDLHLHDHVVVIILEQKHCRRQQSWKRDIPLMGMWKPDKKKLLHGK
jgi:hypothetical protein